MARLAPQLLATPLQPFIQGVQRGKARHRLPKLMASVLNPFLDLPFFPACRGIAERRLENIVADHGEKARVHLPLLAGQDLIDRGFHIVVDAALRHAAEHPEGVVVGVKQHLVGLQQIGAHEERPAVRKLELRDLQLGPLAGDDRPILAPVELERFAWLENQRDKRAAAGGLLLAAPLGFPGAGKSGHATIGAGESERDEIRM